MNAEIVSIGTELLLGHVVNTNAAYLSRKLAGLGIEVYHHASVGDNPARLTDALRQAFSRSDIVITTGGLGPTVDDITIETVARLTGRRLILNRVVLKDLSGYFKANGIRVPPDSLRQAYIPEGAKVIRNKLGTAPALIIEAGDKTKPRTTNHAPRTMIICLPGPPRELEPIFADRIIPYLKRRVTANLPIVSRVIKITGLAESQVNRIVKDLLMLKPPTTVGIYARLGEVDLKIMTKARSAKEAAANIGRIERIIRSRLGGYIFGYDDGTLEDAVAEALIEKGMTIAVAESCTGGLVSSRLTDVGGSSKYFICSTVTYSNESKENILAVPRRLIERHGAVSKETALAMAKGIKHFACVDIGLGATGIAGPAGGTKTKPVGLVYIAFVSDRKRLAKKFRFHGSRKDIKLQASQAALDLIRRNV